MYVAWSDASVRENIGYISFVLFKDGELIFEEVFKANNIDSFVLEKVALRECLHRISMMGIPKHDLNIYTDHKGIVQNLSRRRSDDYIQFEVSLGKKVMKKYRNCISWKSGKHNKAHNLSRFEGLLNYFDFNIIEQFV